MPRVLSFNITDAEKVNQLSILSIRLNFALTPIPREQQGCLIRDLICGAPGVPARVRPFDEEMLILVDFDHADLNFLLNELVRTGQGVGLKAVATPTNIGWTAAELYKRLKSEEESMRRR